MVKDGHGNSYRHFEQKQQQILNLNYARDYHNGQCFMIMLAMMNDDALVFFIVVSQTYDEIRRTKT